MAQVHGDGQNVGRVEDEKSKNSASDYETEKMTDMRDTTAEQARQGKDIQGIPWDRLQFTREKYRETRLQKYKNYLNLMHTEDELEKAWKAVEKEKEFYHFRHNTRSVKSKIVHFQLRNLVWATSNDDVYLVQESHSVVHWSPSNKKATEVLNVAGAVDPAMQISTMCVKRNLLAAGGFQGEMVCKNLDRTEVSFSAKITHDHENAVTNAIEIYDNSSGAVRLMTSSNDSSVRVFDCDNFSVLNRFSLPWAVNHHSVSPDSKTVVLVGDHNEGLLADSQTGEPIATLRGHLDYSFASAWHPDGRVFATGNQDTTCRLWDTRYLGSSLAMLKGRIGAIRSIRFSADGRCMVMAEPADFVHVFDVEREYSQCQEIDLFGEVAGASFSPDSEALFVGVADRTYGSLLEFSRGRTTSVEEPEEFSCDVIKV